MVDAVVASSDRIEGVSAATAMGELQDLLQGVTALTPVTVGWVALSGLLVGIAPSSFALLSVAAGLAAARSKSDKPGFSGLWLSVGFALGIATTDAVIGALFGLAGFAVIRVLASFMAVAYALLAALLIVTGLALLRLVHLAIPMFAPSFKPARTFLGSYVLGLPFGLSTCPACTPLVLPVVLAAATTADPLLGAILMFSFGVARGVPIVVTGSVAAKLSRLRQTSTFIRWVERIGGGLMLAAAVYFLYRAAWYAGWLSP
jgi:cytochrome c-type biogenesis protein